MKNHNQLSINEARFSLLQNKGFNITYKRGEFVKQSLDVSFVGEQQLLFRWAYKIKIVKQVVDLALTKTNFGGERLWFVCPHCKRKCGSLFDLGSVWWCQQCGSLKYETASGSKSERPWCKIYKTLSKVRYPEYVCGFEHLTDFNKPKYMRWKTWRHIHDEHNKLVDDTTAFIMTNQLADIQEGQDITKMY